METDIYESLVVDATRVITRSEALERGLIEAEDVIQPGDMMQLALHPLGTDYLGRDMLARLMEGARVSSVHRHRRAAAVRAAGRRVRQRGRLRRRRG